MIVYSPMRSPRARARAILATALVPLLLVGSVRVEASRSSKISCVPTVAFNVARLAHAAEDAKTQSRNAFKKGVELAKKKDYPGARDAFLQAYKLFPHPSILLNLGMARAQTGEFVEAEGDLLKFLNDDGGAPPEELASARTTLADVRDHLGTLKIKVVPETAVARIDARTIPLAAGEFSEIKGTVGDHKLHIESDGFVTIDEPLVLKKGEVITKEVTLKAAGPAAKSTEPHKDAAQETPTEAPPPQKANHTLSYVLIGGGALLLGAGVYCGVTALGLASDYKETPKSSIRQKGVFFRTAADVGIIAGLIAAGVGVYLLVKPQKTPPTDVTGSTASQSASRPPRIAIDVAVSPEFTGLVGQF